MSKRDPYEVLGVPQDATPDEIKSAYRRLARKHHPDVNPNDPHAEETFKEVGEAYSILSDPEKRSRYDRFGTAEESPDPFFGSGGGFGDIFEMLFGAQMQGPRQRRMGRDGEDIRADVELTLGEVVTGVHRDISVNRMSQCDACSGTGSEGGAAPVACKTCGGQGQVSQTRDTFIGTVRTATTCPTCGGAGSTITNPCGKCRGRGLTQETARIGVTIPAGVDSGATMHLPGQGCDGTGYGKPGDLYVVLTVKPDKRYERDGRNLVTRISLTFAQAALGDTVKVEGVDQEFDMEVPAGTQPGAVLGIRDAGLPPLHGGKRGELLVVVNVAVPTKLSDQEVEHLQRFAEMRGEPVPQGQQGGGLLGGLFKKRK
jgi:molecular chaperone DnaJ